METTEIKSDKSTLNQVGLRQGIILGLILIIYSLVMFVTDWQFTYRWLGWGPWLIVIVALAWTMSEFKKQNNGFMTYSQGLGLGSLTTIVAAIVSSGFSILYMTVIDPNFNERILEMIRIQMIEQNPDFSDQQLDLAMSYVQWGFKPEVMFFTGIITTFLLGFLASLIIAAFMQKKPSDPFA